MTRERAKELLPIIQAYAEGKTIQARLGDYDSFTDQVGDLIFKDTIEYRVKPEPREFWFVTFRDNSGTLHESEESAKAYAGATMSKTKTVHAREVL